jgi:hypothetical protein
MPLLLLPFNAATAAAIQCRYRCYPKALHL